MEAVIVFRENQDELLKALFSLREQEGQAIQSVSQTVGSDEPDISSSYYEDLIEDEDLPLIVQIRVDDEYEMSPGFPMQKWVDTNVPSEDLDEYRERFPESEYRLVAVYDEIVSDELESVEQYVTAEDEIDALKAEVIQLKAQLENKVFNFLNDDKQEF